MTRIGAYLVGMLVLGAAASGCDGDDVGSWIARTRELRETALIQAQVTPYRQEQHVALKAYFGELAEFALALKGQKKLRKGLNLAFEGGNPDDLCRATFVTRDEHGWISENCRKGRYFVCAEEVRAVSASVEGIRSALNPAQQARFDQSVSCRELLE